jgi:hypothetical protein
MTAKPTATLRVEWRADRKLILKEIVAIDEDRRPVTLRVLDITPDPAPDAEPERRLVEYARRVAVQAELVVIGKKRLASVSRSGATSALKYIHEAVERLQAFEQSLNYRIGE